MSLCDKPQNGIKKQCIEYNIQKYTRKILRSDNYSASPYVFCIFYTLAYKSIKYNFRKKHLNYGGNSGKNSMFDYVYIPYYLPLCCHCYFLCFFCKKSYIDIFVRIINRQKSQKIKSYKMFKKSLTCADFRYNIGSVIRA